MAYEEYTARHVDDAGIEWETKIIDPTNGVFVRTRITPRPGKPNPLRPALEITARHPAYIREVPADMDSPLFMAGWLSSNATPNSRSAAVEILTRQFPKESADDVAQAALLYAKDRVSLA